MRIAGIVICTSLVLLVSSGEPEGDIVTMLHSYDIAYDDSVVSALSKAAQAAGPSALKHSTRSDVVGQVRRKDSSPRREQDTSISAELSSFANSYDSTVSPAYGYADNAEGSFQKEEEQSTRELAESNEAATTPAATNASKTTPTRTSNPTPTPTAAHPTPTPTPTAAYPTRGSGSGITSTPTPTPTLTPTPPPTPPPPRKQTPEEIKSIAKYNMLQNIARDAQAKASVSRKTWQEADKAVKKHGDYKGKPKSE